MLYNFISLNSYLNNDEKLPKIIVQKIIHLIIIAGFKILKEKTIQIPFC